MTTILESVKLYGDALNSNRSISTQRQYYLSAEKFIDYLRNMKLDIFSITMKDLDHKYIFDYIDYVRSHQPELNIRTVHLYITGYKNFITWCTDMGLIDWEFTDERQFKLRRQAVIGKDIDYAPKIPKHLDMKIIMDAVEFMQSDKEIIRLRNVALIYVLATSGCRNCEASTMKIGDFNLADKTVKVVGKNGQDRICHYSDKTLESLLEYWNFRGNSDKDNWAFERHARNGKGNISTATIRTITSTLGKLAGVDVFTPQMFRHAAAREMMKNTSDTRVVQSFLGHSKVSTTRKLYGEATKEDVEETYNKAFG